MHTGPCTSARALNLTTLVSPPSKFTLADRPQVLLYNFFEDSTATPNQWRLVLNGISDGDGLPGVPTFDETRHASICAEVFCLLPELLLVHPQLTHDVWDGS